MNTHFDELPSKLPERGSSQKRQIVEEMLVSFIHENGTKILGTAKLYVKKFNLAKDSNYVDTIAQDIVQETVLILLKKSEEELVKLNHITWVNNVILNVIRNYQRKNKRLTIVSNISDFQKNIAFQDRELSEEQILDILIKKIEQQPTIDNKLFLDKILSLVGKEFEEIIKLHFYEELDGKELAAHLGVNEGTARVKLCRAKKALLTVLENHDKS